MANKEEEIISNISYTNSDFRTIYPQLLDTVKVLTNKWDPSMSNESDPGNILIKEAAIIGDKNNYHVDKNVLECFPLSATQQASARQLYDLVGYTMHWYKSAYTDIIFTLSKSFDTINTTNDTNLTQIVIPANTQIVDATGEYVYTTTLPALLENRGEAVLTQAIQGTIEQYEINGTYTITLENLDENQRLYFPHNLIAENGIFVCTAGTNVANGFNKNISSEDVTFWEQVDNLAQYPTKSKVFKFGLDLYSDACYIQFPEDIMSSDLIGNGLNVYYTTTLGKDGTIKTGILNKFASDLTLSSDITGTTNLVVNDYIVISNKSSTQGADPETLNAAYKNYKRLIGTYDSLISRRDYENAIYGLLNSFGTSNLVSNSFVADRTVDPNYTQPVMTTDLVHNYIRSEVETQEINGSQVPILQSYDIILYLLKAVNNVATTADYNTTFDIDTDSVTKTTLESELAERKAIQHTFSFPKTTVIPSGPYGYFNIDNLLALVGTVTTYYKVDTLEANEIQSNIIQALISKYNARELEYGQKLEYEELVETIKSADDRIRSVTLNTTVYHPNMQFTNNFTKSLYGTEDADVNYPTATAINNKIVAKSILAGNVQLFKFDKSFQLEFGQDQADVVNNIVSITTSNPITIEDDEATVLQQNDIMQIITPHLADKEVYGALVKVVANFSMDADSTYVLNTGDIIKFIYTNNSVTTHKTYTGPGTILKTVNFTLNAITDSANYTHWNDDSSERTTLIKAQQSINIVEVSNITIPEKCKYYIVTNNINNNNQYELTLSSDSYYILKENEYFLYVDDTGTGIIRLESGFGLKLAGAAGQTETLTSDIISLENILESTVEDAVSLWKALPKNLNAQDNDIVTLTDGDTIRLLQAGSFSTDNDFKQVKSGNDLFDLEYRYFESESTTQIKQIDRLPEFKIFCRSVLQLKANNVTPQTLHAGQSLTLTLQDNSTSTISAGESFLLNYPLDIAGGTDIDVRVLDEFTGKYEAYLSLYHYEDESISSTNPDISREKGLIILDNDSFDNSNQVTLRFTFNDTSDYKYYLIPVDIRVPEGEKITVSITDGSVGRFFSFLNNTFDPAVPTEFETSEICCLAVDTSAVTGATDLTFTRNGTSAGYSITIGEIKRLAGLNSTEINSTSVVGMQTYLYDIEDQLSNVLTEISQLPGYNYFDWAYEVPATNKVLQPVTGDAYFNVNHIFNKITISKIDFDNSSIKVSPSSLKQ